LKASGRLDAVQLEAEMRALRGRLMQERIGDTTVVGIETEPGHILWCVAQGDTLWYAYGRELAETSAEAEILVWQSYQDASMVPVVTRIDAISSRLLISRGWDIGLNSGAVHEIRRDGVSVGKARLGAIWATTAEAFLVDTFHHAVHVGDVLTLPALSDQKTTQQSGGHEVPAQQPAHGQGGGATNRP
jgi:hypothetical protein